MFYQGQEPTDITAYCFGFAGIVMLTVYAVFVGYMTQHGDFYQKRRWKASILAAILSSALFIVVILISLSIPIIGQFLKKPAPLFEHEIRPTGYLYFELISILLVCWMSFMFIVTFGTHYRLKWWLNSDDFLDKIWKDPDKNRKSPIQWL